MLRRKFIALLMFIAIVGVCLIFMDKTGYYHYSVFSADKIRIIDIDKGENIIYVVDDLNRKNIIQSIYLFPKSKANFVIQDNQVYKVEFSKKNIVLLTVFVGRVQNYENKESINFQPTNSSSKNTMLYEYKNENYICYNRKFYISWSEKFYEFIFDKIDSQQILH
jgi:hypothetical protein